MLQITHVTASNVRSVIILSLKNNTPHIPSKNGNNLCPQVERTVAGPEAALLWTRGPVRVLFIIRIPTRLLGRRRALSLHRGRITSTAWCQSVVIVSMDG